MATCFDYVMAALILVLAAWTVALIVAQPVKKLMRWYYRRNARKQS